MATAKRPSSESSEDNFRLVSMATGNSGGISATAQHRHITLTSSKIVVSRGTSPIQSKSSKSNRDDMRERWSSVQRKETRQFQGEDLVKWIQERGEVSEADIRDLCCLLLRVRLLENVDKESKGEFDVSHNNPISIY